MTIWARFTNRLRDAMDRDGVGGSGGRGAAAAVSLAERLGLTTLSDDALGAELERRRRARGRSAHRRCAADEELEAVAEARRARTRERPLSRAYKTLEIGPGATRGEVERAYRGLLRQYHPDRHIGDEEQHKSAVALATTLTDAVLALVEQDRRA